MAKVDLTRKELEVVFNMCQYVVRQGDARETQRFRSVMRKITAVAPELLCEACGENWAEKRGLCPRCYQVDYRQRRAS